MVRNDRTTLMLVGLLALASGCTPEPRALPTEMAVLDMDRGQLPPLYQLLYDTPALPGSRRTQQRVRILIWLRHMNLTTSQLQRLHELELLADERRRRISDAERELGDRWEIKENRIYDQLWRKLSGGTPVDDPGMAEATHDLREFRAGGEREREMLKLRLQGIRAVLEAQQDFLATLSPKQESLLGDAVFFLRNRLDPIGNPGDFRALVGTIYDPGQYSVLTRGSSDWARAPLNIGALWSDSPPIEGGALHEARREVLLYLILLEDGLDEAIDAARILEEKEEAGDEAGEDTGGAEAPTPKAPDQPPQ